MEISVGYHTSKESPETLGWVRSVKEMIPRCLLGSGGGGGRGEDSPFASMAGYVISKEFLECDCTTSFKKQH